MKPQQLPQLLVREDFLRDLHHLLWTEPQLNERVKVFDEGWSCRDHALIVAGVARMLGFNAVVLHGNARFVQGGSEEARPIVMDMSTHSWVGVEGAGWYDLSVRLGSVTQFGSEWTDWRVASLAASRFVPEGRVRLIRADTPAQFENAFSAALNLNGTNTAIYGGGNEYWELTAKLMSRGVESCNSLLTDWLVTEFGEREDFHARAILHLFDLLNGKASALAGLSRAEAWKKLLERPGDAVWRVCSRGRIV